MTIPEHDPVAVAINNLADQVDQLGNAVQSAANTIAAALKGIPTPPPQSGVTPGGTFS